MVCAVIPLTFDDSIVKNAEPSSATFIFRNADRSVCNRPQKAEEPMQHEATGCEESMEGYLVTDITLARNTARIRIVAPRETCDCARLIAILEAQGIRLSSVDVACTSGSDASTEITLMLRQADLSRARLLIQESFGSSHEYDVQCDNQLATVTIMGFGVSFDLTTVARVVGSLGQQRIGVHELTTTEDRIDCFVDPEGAERAVAILHQEIGRRERVA
jgi:aspartate kinase